jgi:hypothetical protein
MSTKSVNRFYRYTKRLLKQNAFVFYFLQPALLVLTGYYLVACPLPVFMKTTLFGATCLINGWLVYRLFDACQPVHR